MERTIGVLSKDAPCLHGKTFRKSKCISATFQRYPCCPWIPGHDDYSTNQTKGKRVFSKYYYFLISKSGLLSQKQFKLKEDYIF